MEVKDILENLSLGSSVAEFDDALEKYFVETETFRKFVKGQGDIVAGDKGTGKTALYKIIKERSKSYPELEAVEIIPGFNPSGNPIFQRMAQGEKLSEGQYSSIWKTYVLSLVGNWALAAYGPTSESARELQKILQSLGLESKDTSPGKIMSMLMGLIERLTQPKSIEGGLVLTEAGMPAFTGKVEYPQALSESLPLIRHEEALRHLNNLLGENEFVVWLVLDRLDEAFQGYPDTELPALKALLRTYLDLAEFSNIRLKLFVRNDLFRKITAGGFVNLTHVNARKIEIVWDDEDLYDLLHKRFQESDNFLGNLNLSDAAADPTFNAIFPEQVDPGRCGCRPNVQCDIPRAGRPWQSKTENLELDIVTY